MASYSKQSNGPRLATYVDTSCNNLSTLQADVACAVAEDAAVAVLVSSLSRKCAYTTNTSATGTKTSRLPATSPKLIRFLDLRPHTNNSQINTMPALATHLLADFMTAYM